MAPAETKAKSPEYEAAVDHAPPSHFAIAYDLNRKGSKTYLGFPTLGKLLEWYDRTRQRSCYEIIRETKPASVAFDLELEFSKPEHAAIAELHGFTRGAPGAFLETAVARITAEFPQLLDGAPPLVSTSHAPGVKHSFHIKYASHFLPTQAHRGAFGEAVRTKLADLVPIDAGVYSRNRPMRLLYSAKGSDSTRSLVPAGSDTTFDIGAVRDHVVLSPMCPNPQCHWIFLLLARPPTRPTVREASSGSAQRQIPKLRVPILRAASSPSLGAHTTATSHARQPFLAVLAPPRRRTTPLTSRAPTGSRARLTCAFTVTTTRNRTIFRLESPAVL